MTEESKSKRTPAAPDPLTQASQLLRVGFAGPFRAIDDLVERLGRPDGPQWLAPALEAGPLGELGVEALALADGRLTVEQLTAIKDRSKKLISNSTSDDDRLAALAGYFLSIASALRHHRRLIGGRGRGDLRNMLLDLAEFAPQPFSDVLCGATLVQAEEYPPT